MRSDDLTREQARALKNKLAPMLGYLNRLAKRMTRRRFPPDDPLLLEVCRAAAAMHELNVSVHYLSCGCVSSGYPEPPKFAGAALPQPHDQPQHHGNQRRGD